MTSLCQYGLKPPGSSQVGLFPLFQQSYLELLMAAILRIVLATSGSLAGSSLVGDPLDRRPALARSINCTARASNAAIFSDLERSKSGSGFAHGGTPAAASRTVAKDT